MQPLVMAVDPGPESGWAVGRAKAVVHVGRARRVAGEWDRGEEHQVSYLLGVAEEHQVGVVVIEDFILRLPVKGTDRDGISAARVGFGLYVGLGLALPSVRRVWQQPGDMGVIREDDVRLKRGRVEHERDAIRHLLCYGRKMGNMRLVDPNK